MELQTRLTVPEIHNPISYGGETLLLGSCFAGHMAGKLSYFKFRNTFNPFGILFHPKAISNLVIRALEEREFTEADCFYHGERWHSHEVHSDLSRTDREELLNHLNSQRIRTKEVLERAGHIIFTLGTAWGYVKRSDGKWVANCHKVPQKEFEKVLSTPDEIRQAMGAALSRIFKVNPRVSVILTVSPVRHIRDGFVQNQWSKAHLITAVHGLLKEFEGREIFYFPSYELMMDELRDYRFYEQDMLHPNTTAVDYIWERFRSSCIDREDYAPMEEVEAIQKGLAHKPFNPGSQAYKDFRKELDAKVASLMKKYPFMSFG